jgi:hypothetical protein
MTKNICFDCGTEENVKAAGEYAELAELLDAWNLFETQGNMMLCPGCASAVSGEISLDKVKILPLDFFETNDPDDEL